MARREIARFEPLLHAAPHIEKKVNSVLGTVFSQVISEEKHREFIEHLERIQTRMPVG